MSGSLRTVRANGDGVVTITCESCASVTAVFPTTEAGYLLITWSQ